MKYESVKFESNFFFPFPLEEKNMKIKKNIIRCKCLTSQRVVLISTKFLRRISDCRWSLTSICLNVTYFLAPYRENSFHS